MHTPQQQKIRCHIGYVQITYAEFFRIRNTTENYKASHWFIPVQGVLLEVLKDAYKAFYREKERERYLRKLDSALFLCNLDLKSEKIPLRDENTDDNGTAKISELPLFREGTRTLIQYTVEKDRQIIQITRKNTPSVGSVSVRKITPDGTALNGVSFLLQYSTDGGTAWSPVRARKETDSISVGSCTSAGISDGVLTTGEDGKVTFNGLQVKNQNVTVLYRITEVRTKDGFQLLGEPLFEGTLPQDVNGTPQRDITITAVNGHQFELPAAGGNGMQTAAIGMIFVVIGLFGLLYIQKEKF